MVSGVVDLLNPLLENSAVAITVVDAEGNLTLFNRAAEILTGYPRNEVLGRPVSLFYDSPQEADGIAQAVLAKGKIEDHVTHLTSRDGRRIPVSILVTALSDAAGRFVGSLAITVDISERRTLEEAVRREKQRVVFYNDLLCHDLRNFSQTSLGILELLLSGDDLTGEKRRLLQVCHRQSRRARDLINRVRTLASLESEEGDPVEPTPLGPAIEEAVAALEESFPDRDLTVHAPSDVDVDVAVKASSLLVDVLYNLLANGVAHNLAPRPTLWVRVYETHRDAKPFVEIHVEDDGPGIPDERKCEIFERYGSMHVKGSGIGLSLVKALVVEYGGAVWAEDRVAGQCPQGARLVMALSRAAPGSGG